MLTVCGLGVRVGLTVWRFGFGVIRATWRVRANRKCKWINDGENGGHYMASRG